MRDEVGKVGQPQTEGILQIYLDFQLFLKRSGVFLLPLHSVTKMKNSNHFFFLFNLPKIF